MNDEPDVAGFLRWSGKVLSVMLIGIVIYPLVADAIYALAERYLGGE